LPAGWIVVVLLGGLVLAGVLGWRTQSDQPGYDHLAPAHATTDGTGVVDGDGPVTVEIWLDLHCGGCDGRAAAETVLDQLAEVNTALEPLVAENVVTRIVHPVALVDESTRIAASVACAADRDAHPQYLSALLASERSSKARDAVGTTAEPQSRDGSALTDDELVHLAGRAGVVDPAFAQCIRAERYLDWARIVTASAATAKVATVPAVRVAGAEVETTSAAVVSAVAAVNASSEHR
jgi:hypothetical protein